MRALCVALTLTLPTVAVAQPDLAAEHNLTDPGLYAVFQTSMGTFVAELFEDGAPKTVQNFVDLATGAKEWRAVDRSALNRPVQELPVHSGEPFFDGTIFHRVIPDFMIQGGAPRGIENPGAGGPGFTIEDEFNEDLLHDLPGRLSMANVGRPNTGSSQFFVTVAETPWLDFTNPRNLPRNAGHTVFGQVIRNYDAVEAISKVDRDGADRPTTDVVLEKVSIVRVGESASPPTAVPSSPE